MRQNEQADTVVESSKRGVVHRIPNHDAAFILGSNKVCERIMLTGMWSKPVLVHRKL